MAAAALRTRVQYLHTSVCRGHCRQLELQMPLNAAQHKPPEAAQQKKGSPAALTLRTLAKYLHPYCARCLPVAKRRSLSLPSLAPLRRMRPQPEAASCRRSVALPPPQQVPPVHLRHCLHQPCAALLLGHLHLLVLRPGVLQARGRRERLIRSPELGLGRLNRAARQGATPR